MPAVSIPNTTSTQLIAENTEVKKHALWVQNFNTGTGVYLECKAAASAESFYIPPAASATSPGTLVVQSTGGDSTLVNAEWRAYQASGGSVNVNVGRW